MQEHILVKDLFEILKNNIEYHMLSSDEEKKEFIQSKYIPVVIRKVKDGIMNNGDHYVVFSPKVCYHILDNRFYRTAVKRNHFSFEDIELSKVADGLYTGTEEEFTEDVCLGKKKEILYTLNNNLEERLYG